MTKYTRVTGKVFGASADPTGDNPEIGQFGSALATTYLGTSDISTIQSLPAWSNGFIGCVTPNTQFPPLPEMTGFGKVLSQQICYLLQQGVPEYDSGTIYYTGNWCSYNNNLYTAKQDGFSNHNPTETAFWSLFTGNSPRNYGEIVTSSLPISDNTLHLADGSLLSGDDYPDLFDYISSIYSQTSTTVYCWTDEVTPTIKYYTKSTNPYTNQDIVYDSNGSRIGNTVYAQPFISPNRIYINFYSSGVTKSALRSSTYDTNMSLLSEPFCTETEWQNFKTSNTECGYYVYDSINNTLRIPLYSSYFTNTTNIEELGRFTRSSLPNITGQFVAGETTGYSGAFSGGGTYSSSVSTPGGSSDHITEFRASASSNVYSSYTTKVITNSIKQLVYIVVGK